jgi:hypothetical protein
MNIPMLETYSDYLLVSTGLTPATGLSRLLGGSPSHDRVTRFLASIRTDSAMLWSLVKPTVRQLQAQQGDEGVLIFDDTIIEKPYTDENAIVCWHYDHCTGRNVKGINVLSALYHRNGVSIPVAYEAVSKTVSYIDSKGRLRRTTAISKNAYMRWMLDQCVENGLNVRYVLADSWYSSAESMVYIKERMGLDWIMPLKCNRKVALSKAAKKRGEYVAITSLTLEEHATTRVYLTEVDFAVLLSKVVFTNGDGTRGVLYLATSDLTLSYEQMTTIYKKRWNVEQYHQSLKGNASIAKSPAKRVQTQKAHILAALYAFMKLERISAKLSRNHHELKSTIYFFGLQAALQKLNDLEAQARFKPMPCVR